MSLAIFFLLERDTYAGAVLLCLECTILLAIFCAPSVGSLFDKAITFSSTCCFWLRPATAAFVFSLTVDASMCGFVIFIGARVCCGSSAANVCFWLPSAFKAAPAFSGTRVWLCGASGVVFSATIVAALEAASILIAALFAAKLAALASLLAALLLCGFGVCGVLILAVPFPFFFDRNSAPLLAFLSACSSAVIIGPFLGFMSVVLDFICAKFPNLKCGTGPLLVELVPRSTCEPFICGPRALGLGLGPFSDIFYILKSISK